jgi:hypothetical protein
MDSCGNSNGSSGPDAARTGTGYAATGGDGTAGFWYRTDSFPVTGQGSAPYHEPVTGGAYDGYVGINRCARLKAAAHGGQVLVSKTTRDLAGGRLGGGFGLKRLGEFRLRDLAEPELIYQLTHVSLPADFPPLVTLAERTGNLPLPVSSFIGRERELEQTAAAPRPA